MKKSFPILLAILFLGFISACTKDDTNKGPDPKVDLPLTQVEWEQNVHDFGNITTDKVVKHKYYFTNIGDKDLKVYRVKPSCNCTAGDWTRELVPPGGRGFVELQFDPTGKQGKVSKSARVLMNAEPQLQELKFQAMIEE